MNKLNKIIKLIEFLKKRDSNFCSEHWIVRRGKLYHATWDVDHHNGDIDDYKEELVKSNNKELDDLLSSLEIDFEDFVREEELNKIVKKKLEEVYKQG